MNSEKHCSVSGAATGPGSAGELGLQTRPSQTNITQRIRSDLRTLNAVPTAPWRIYVIGSIPDVCLSVCLSFACGT
eukprot:7242048-Pyramimonas_sp.AAC.1